MTTQKNRQTPRALKGIQPLFLAAVFLIGFGAVGASVRHFSSAATTAITLYASPAAQTVTSGDNVVVQIHVKDASAVNVTYAKAAMTFPVNLLQVASVSTTGSSFTTEDAQTYSNTAGAITIGRTGKTYNAKVTDFLLATVTFKSVGSGTANVAFTSASTVAAAKGDANKLTGSSGATYTIQKLVAPAPTPQPSTNPAPPTVTSGGGSSDNTVNNSGRGTRDGTATTTADQGPGITITLPKQTTPINKTTSTLTISHVQATDITTAGGTLEWQTSKPSDVVIRYDANSHNYSKELSVSGLETIHSVALHSLPMGSHVYYKIVVTAKDGSTATYSGEFTTVQPQSKTFTLVAAGSGGGLGLIVLVLLMARLLRHRKLPPVATQPTFGAPPAAPTADMSHAVAALALENMTATEPLQSVLAGQPTAPLQLPTVPANPPQTVQRSAIQTDSQQRPNIAPVPRKVITTERPTLHPALPSSYTQPRANEPLDMFEEGNQRLSQEGYPDEPQR